MDIDKLFEFEECEKGYTLKNYLLEDDTSVTEVEIPSKYKGKPVIGIGFDAFLLSRHLRSVKIGEGVEEIGFNAFMSCTELRSVILPRSLKKIYLSAFNNCRKLKDIAFPESLEFIDNHVFMGCKGLRSVELPQSLTELGKSAFSDCEGLRSIVIPPKIKVIRYNAFGNCENLENIEFPKGIEEIERYAFYGCGLRQLRFPSGLKKIGSGAFHHCLRLERIDFGKGSPWFAESAFEHCPKLSAENVIQGLARSVDITKPFPKGTRFEWDLVLREDVFALALKCNSFALYDKDVVWQEIVKRNFVGFLSMAEKAGWEISEKCMGELLDISTQKGFTETTAWLLDYKNRKIGFGKS